MDKDFDFGGYATKADMLCSDGRIIKKNAFKECDGKTVPLIWNHQHNEVDAVLGHAYLENRDDGVYAYGKFNDTPSGQHAKLLVQSGDVDRLSIFANRLKHNGNEVIHGIIRELSLVFAGANPGAYIESVIMHGDDSYEEGYIGSGEYLNVFDSDSIAHANEDKKEKNEMENKNKEKTVTDVLETLTEEQLDAVYALVGQVLEDAGVDLEESDMESKKQVKHSDDEEKTVKEVIDTLTEEQLDAVNLVVGQILEDAGITDEEDDNIKHSEDFEGGNDIMKHNLFDQESSQEEILTHSEMMEIFDDAKRTGSLKDSFLAHGIENIDYLFPDAKTVDATPGFIKRDDTWVAEVMKRVHKTPFSRIKSVFANITEADARAKGYIKGNMKTEEFFSLMKRITTPTTIYKKQSIDRDDVVDIIDFDTVAWLKTEMRMMLDEEIARAVLVGDGRSSSSNNKINEQNVRPIWKDDDVFTIKAEINTQSMSSDDEKARAFIKAAIKSRKNYKGSGNPDMFISEDTLTSCLLLEDKNGRVIYDSIDKLATALRVRKIIPVPVMDGLTRQVSSNVHTLAGIYVNLIDYNIGADKGGAVNMFDDFDIDYNAQKYLIETRCSGALTKPFSAVAIEYVQAA